MKYRRREFRTFEAIRYLGPKSIDEMLEVWGKDFAHRAKYWPQFNELSVGDYGADREVINEGDWVTRYRDGFTVYTDELFHREFEPVPEAK